MSLSVDNNTLDTKNQQYLADRLLDYIRRELDDQSIQYRSPPTPLKGGAATDLFRFRLKDTSEVLSQPLVLRFFPHYYPAGQAVIEGLVHNALVDAGYPVPPVLFMCSDVEMLGGEFIVMKFMPGEMLTRAYPLDRPTIPAMLASAHIALHTIDLTPVLQTFAENGITRTFMSSVDHLESRIEARQLTWLLPALQWIKDNYPTDIDGFVLCHGDFHTNNILVDHGQISAVLDWSGCGFGAPEADIARTIFIFTSMVPYLPVKLIHSLLGIIPRVDWDEFTNRYYECYRRELPLVQSRVDYYEALHCFRDIVTVQSGSGQSRVLDHHPAVQARSFRRFTTITGITLRKEN